MLFSLHIISRLLLELAMSSGTKTTKCTLVVKQFGMFAILWLGYHSCMVWIQAWLWSGLVFIWIHCISKMVLCDVAVLRNGYIQQENTKASLSEASSQCFFLPRGKRSGESWCLCHLISALSFHCAELKVELQHFVPKDVKENRIVRGHVEPPHFTLLSEQVLLLGILKIVLYSLL